MSAKPPKSRLSDFVPMMLAYSAESGIWLIPFLIVYGFVLGALISIYLLICRVSIRIVLNGPGVEALRRTSIEAFWHRYFFIYMLVRLPYRKQVWLNHPKAYMAPWYFAGKLLGVYQMIPGSSGNRGRDAAQEILNWLKAGFSTSIIPDGPGGPAFKLKKGALHLSIQSGVPILAARMRVKRALALPTWDRKIIPIPFVSRVEISFSGPFIAHAQNLEDSARHLEELLKN